MHRAAMYEQGWIPYMYTPEMLHESLDKIHQFGKEAGRDLSAFRPGLFIFASIYADREKAKEQAAKALGGTEMQNDAKLTGRYMLFGNLDDARTRIQEYVDPVERTV